jgi:hypothetical protein
VENIKTLYDRKPSVDHGGTLSREYDDIRFFDPRLKKGNIFKKVFGFFLYFDRGYPSPAKIGPHSFRVRGFQLSFLDHVLPVLTFPFKNLHDQPSLGYMFSLVMPRGFYRSEQRPGDYSSLMV